MPGERMIQWRGTATEWATKNPILAPGEVGVETDTNLIKLGDGVTPWNDLLYLALKQNLDTLQEMLYRSLDDRTNIDGGPAEIIQINPSGRRWLFGDQSTVVYATNGGTAQHRFDHANGEFQSKGSQIPITSWGVDWENNDNGSTWVQAHVIRTGALVTLYGLVKRVASGSANSNVLDLPVGYRPANRLMYLQNGQYGPLRVDVYASGLVQVVGGPTGAYWLTLSGISFYSAAF